MPPKRKASGGRKAQGTAAPKAKAKAAKTPSKAKPKVAVVTEPAVESEPGSAEKVDSKAWSMQKDIERLINNKLSFIDPLDIKSRRSTKEGLTVKQYLQVALEENAAKAGRSGKRQYLTGEFWTEFFKDFKFKNAGFHGLRSPDESKVSLDDNYWEAMGVANSENPGVQSAEPWCDVVNNLKDINEDSLIALFHASTNSRVVTVKMSRKMQLSLAGLCGRLQVPARFPAVWRVVSDKLDSVLTWHWQQKANQDTLIDRRIWAQTHHDAVKPFIAESDFEECEGCADMEEDCRGPALHRVLQSSLGQAMFYEEAKKFQINAFIERCHSRAGDLIHSGFTDENIDGYRAAADVDIAELVRNGHKMYKRGKADKRNILFLNAQVEVYPSSLNDIKDWILRARACSVAVSNGQLPRLPWERVLWGDEALPNLGSTEKVPENLIFHARNSRNLMRRVAGEWGPGRTLATMQEDIVNNQKDILETERAACLDVAFVMHKVHGVADAWAQEEVIQALASTTSPGRAASAEDMLKCLKEVKKLRGDRRFACLPSGVSDDIHAIESLISAMLDGIASEVRLSTSGTSLFMQKALDTMALWLKCSVAAPKKKKDKLNFSTATLVGSEAAQHIFKRVEGQAPEQRQESDLALLRNFSWLLGSHSRDKIDEWIGVVIRQARASVVAAGMIKDGPAADASDFFAASSGSSDRPKAAPSAIAAKSSLLAGPPAKKAKTNDKGGPSMKEKMMKICMGAV